MTKFAEEVLQLPGKHRTNVFALLIAKLASYSTKSVNDKLIIRALLSEVKVLFHDHEQRFAILSFILKQNLRQYRGISLPLLHFLTDVIGTVDKKAFDRYFEKTGEEQCDLQRVFESHVAINMLLNPSKKMWISINHISDVIIALLERYKISTALIPFLKNLGPSDEYADFPYLALAFGRFAHTPKVDEVIAVLKDRNNLATTMLIHFMFMRDVAHNLKQDVSMKTLAAVKGDFGNYLQKIDTKDQSKDLRDFFCDYIKHAPHLYKDRGRGAFEFIASKHMGIVPILRERDVFPCTDAAWFPDSLCQRADLFSPYVHALTERDIPYVAGPSGMTSIFCGTMLFLGQWERIQEQHYYLLAVMAFMTSGGLHSIHEVLTIPHVRLGLLPDYVVDGPSAGNYHQFFNLFRQDEVICNNLSSAWRATIEWMNRRYPYLMHIQPLPDQGPPITSGLLHGDLRGRCSIQ